MTLIVQKYGGTSVGSVERIEAVADRVAKHHNAGEQLVVVVSAMSGETNRLLGLAKSILDDPTPRELDIMMSTGEQVSMALLTMALHKRGIGAVSLNGSQVRILTDDSHTKARIKDIDSRRISSELDSRHVVVVAGFLRGDLIPAATQLWIESLATCSDHCIVVLDNQRVTAVPSHWEGDGIDLIAESHGEYDFGSYKRGLAHARSMGWLEQSTHVLLCNDSVIGPLNDLSQVFEAVCGAPDEVVGLTMSYQIRPHLQSFFLMMGRDVFLNLNVTISDKCSCWIDPISTSTSSIIIK